MIIPRKAQERGHANYGWLDTHHTFSFGSYRDPQHERFRSLRVMNEDVIAPGQGFGTHPHHDMEIVTYILSGALEHRDSLGHGEVLRAGEVQRMTAGSGITHSEFNASPSEPVHLYQIWLLPAATGLEPSYEQQAFDPAQRLNRWQLVVSPTRAEGSLVIQQDARIYLANLEPDQTLELPLEPPRHGWLQILRGDIHLAGTRLSAGDGAAISEESAPRITSDTFAELMFFDLA